MADKALSNKTKHKIKEFAGVITLFLIFALINILIRSTGEHFPVGRSIVGAVLLGMMVAYYEIYLSDRIQKKVTQWEYFIVTSFYYFITSTIIIIILAYSTLIFKNDMSFTQAITSNIFEYFGNNNFSISDLFISLFIFISAISLLRENIRLVGYGLSFDALRGRYKNPIIEERIFLMMDLKSSTTYAEQLGALKYSEFIKDIFLEMDDAILETEGLLYQYVGDQIVVVWKKKDGIKNNNCLRLHFLICKRMYELKDYFIEKYNVFPEFKTGIHIGEVAITEVGKTLKREIAYHGDTINTTARICVTCSEIGKKVIISEALLDELHWDKSENNFVCLGAFNLRGKNKIITLFEPINILNTA